jgi:hypothetical protein
MDAIENAHVDSEETAAPSFLVVGIGASAGGLEALERFFDSLPQRTTGMAFVVVQHLSPDFKSLMDELLSRHTSLPIALAEEGMQVEPDHVYLLPPKKELIISAGRLMLSERQQELSLPIDVFFRSLRTARGRHRAIRRGQRRLTRRARRARARRPRFGARRRQRAVRRHAEDRARCRCCGLGARALADARSAAAARA